MRRAATTLALVVASVLALSSCGRDAPPRAGVADAEAARLLVDRNWLDLWPTDKDDHLHVYRFTPSMGGGVYQDRTVFKGTFELFLFTVADGTLTFQLPHTDETVTSRFTIERVDGPAPFDLKLTLDKSPRGPKVFYGRAAETGDAAALDAAIERALADAAR